MQNGTMVLRKVGKKVEWTYLDTHGHTHEGQAASLTAAANDAEIMSGEVAIEECPDCTGYGAYDSANGPVCVRCGNHRKIRVQN